MPAGKLVKLFYSYAHDDESLRDELQKHLSTLKREGVISEWHDRSIRAGQEWDPEIQRELAAADIVLVLLSADFTASQYCAKEVEFALHLHRRGSTRVIPVLLRPVDWSGPLQGLQALPKNSLPVTSWLNRDEAFLDIAQGIRRAAADLQGGAIPTGSSGHPQPARDPVAGDTPRSWFQNSAIVPALIGAIATMLVVIIPVMRLNIQSSLEPISSKGLVAAPNIYRPRVTVLQDGVPNDDAKVWCSAGGEPKKVAGGWQFDIPREGLPSDGEVVFYAEKSSAFRRGQVRLKLLLTAAPTVEINLERDRSAGISGIVQDAIGRALVGVAVNTLGASYTTDERGRFRFKAQWGDGERVVVHAEAPGYKPVDQGHQAGNDVMVIVLDLEKP